MPSTRRVLTALATATTAAVLTAGPAAAATTGYITIYNNCGKKVWGTIHRPNGDMLLGGAALSTGSHRYSVLTGTWLVRVPAGDRMVTVLNLPDRMHNIVVKAC